MKKPILLISLIVASALVFVLDVAFVVFAAVKLGLVTSGQEFLSPQLQTFAIWTMLANIALAIFAAIFIVLKIAMKKTS